MVELGSGGQRQIEDIMLSMHVCYLIVQNADPRKENANKTHFEVGSKVRQTIKELGGTMPEELPTPGK